MDGCGDGDRGRPGHDRAPGLTVRGAKILLLVLLLAWLSLMFWNTAKPLPPGTHLVS